jgi:superoxide dismutase, Fe-Mn family
MPFELPKLPYSLNSLEPIISKQTLEFHYGKHHQAYVNNLNNLAKGTAFEDASLEEIIRNADGGIYNNGAQVWNHTFYFNQFDKKGSKTPGNELMGLIDKTFGSLDRFKEDFNKAAATLFGSGWAWLVVNKHGGLEIVQESNAGNPLKKGMQPLLTCDVWEHAYYLDYQNKRPDYIQSFWDIVDWDIIGKRLQ